MESSRSILEIVVDVMRQASTLLRTEASLARAEMSENFEDLAKGIAMLVAGATLLIPGLVLLLQAAAAVAGRSRRADSNRPCRLLVARHLRRQRLPPRDRPDGHRSPATETFPVETR
jgi:hypothetical protein